MTMMMMMMTPPVAKRDEDRVVYCGARVVVPSIDNNKNKAIPPPPLPPPPLLLQSETSTEALLDPPVAVPDPYGWLRDESRQDEAVLEHLTLENAHTEALTSHLQDLRTTLYDEMVASLQETDHTVPRPRDDKFWYYTRTFRGKSYVVHCRAPKKISAKEEEEEDLPTTILSCWDGSAETPILPGEQVLLDENVLAEGKPYCATGDVKTSPSHRLLAYTVDFSGDETCQLYVVDLKKDNDNDYNDDDAVVVVDHDDSLEIYGSLVWGNDDDETLFYLKMDDAHRPYQVYRRNIVTHTEELLWEESDDLFWVGISKSIDGQYLFVESSSAETSEVHYLDLKNNDTTGLLQCVAKRRSKVLYDVEYRRGAWWITSNVGGTPNMRLLTCPAKADCQDEWRDVVLDNDYSNNNDGTVLFDGGYERILKWVTTFGTHVVASGREGGIPRVWILSLKDEDNDNNAAGGASSSTSTTTKVTSFEPLTFEEEAHDVGLGVHYEFDTDKIVVAYDSLVTPLQHVEIALSDVSQRRVLKKRHVPNYDKTKYGCDRITVTSRDGTTAIPVSIVYRQDVMDRWLRDGVPTHVHLYGYGSYGSCLEADFRATRLPLLDRGIVYVIAHVRGGGEMGRQWYEEPDGAKYLCKKNTFHDFVDVARWLVEEKKLTTPDRLSCEGRSAGGLLIGASLNQAPELFRTAILGVPFVDVVCTMADASIPLTCGEWEEWGNPNEEKFHKYMMEYSPINNVQKGATYPSCLLTGGLHDPRVQYWEPAKFAAQLRHLQSKDSGPVCVKMDMTAGHFSASDRYKYLRELAFDYAFLLDQVGLADGVSCEKN